MNWILAFLLSWTLYGQPFDHKGITYSCDPALAAAVRAWADVSGVSDGGCSDAPDIDVTVRADWPYDAFAVAVQHDGRCTVETRWPDVGLLILTHEVGHCLGLGHSDDPSDVMFPLCCDAIRLGKGDIAGIQSLYGAPEPRFRAVMPMVSQ